MAKPPAKKPVKAKRPMKVTTPRLHYTPELATRILTRLADGEFITHICREPGMPSAQAISEWRIAHPEFGEAYLRARELQAQAVAEAGHKAAMMAGPELDPNAARVRWAASCWMAARLAPRQWSDKPQGEPGTAENPLVVLMQQMRARSLPIAHTPIDSTAEEIDE